MVGATGVDEDDELQFTLKGVNVSIANALRRIMLSDIPLVVFRVTPNDKNKFGQINKTSWDSFSYGIMMGHNVWMHLNAVQEANRQYDNSRCPNMLVDERFDQIFFKDIVEALFATSDKGTALKVIDEFRFFWNRVIGTRGASGKKAINAHSQFANLFDEVGTTSVQLEKEHTEEFSEDEINKLDQLEIEVENDIT